MIHLAKRGGQKGFPMYQNLSIIMSSMYLEKKVNKFLQLKKRKKEHPYFKDKGKPK